MTNQRLEKLLEMEKQKPDDAFLKFAIAQEYVGMKDDATALKYFDLIIERFPQYLAAYYQLGKLYERMDQSSVAANVYKNGIVVAKAVNDLKTTGELNEALMLLEDE
jgi:tetratricopeptide (TPR) repeat protein